MSTQISTIYDNMITRLVALFPTHVRMSNPYRPNDNIERHIENGSFGVAFGPGFNSEREMTCRLSVKREMVVTLTRKAYALEVDGAAKAVAEKQIFEDQLVLIKDFERDYTLSNTISNVKYVSDSGLEYVFDAKDNFIMIRTVCEIEYFENLAP
jgi:hypothetical protein